MMLASSPSPNITLPFTVEATYCLRAVEDRGQMGDVVVEYAHTRHVLPDRDALWLAHHLLHVESLLFGGFRRQDSELVKLNAVR